MGALLHRLRRLAAFPWTRALVTVGLLALVVSQIHLGKAGNRLAHGHWGLFAAATGVVLVALVLASVRWHLFLRAGSIERSRTEVTRAYMIGAFTNNFLPSQIGGDVTRAWIVGGPGARSRALATVVVDRATLLGCLIVLGWVVYAADPAPVPHALVGALAAASAALALAGIIAVALALGGSRVRHRLPERVQGPAGDIGDAVRGCIDAPLLVQTTLLGLVYQALILLAVWLLARSIDVDVAFSVLVVTLPLVLILTTLPVSIGGFGLRESGFVVLLGRAGVPATDATLLSLLIAAAFALATLPGGVLLLLSSARGSVAAAQADQTEQERREDHLDAGDDRGGGQNRELFLGQSAEPPRDPRARDHGAGHEPHGDQARAG